jgi:hypothetical protein
MLPEAQLPDYTKFQDAVIKLYPGVDNERKYAESGLQRLETVQYREQSRTWALLPGISKFLLASLT